MSPLKLIAKLAVEVMAKQWSATEGHAGKNSVPESSWRSE